MSLSNRVIQKFNVADKCQSFQAAFMQFLQSQHNMASVNEIRFDDLKEKLDTKEVMLVDVREPDELKSHGKIPGSFNIPSGQIEEAFALPPALFESKYGFKLPEPDTASLVFSCKSGKRATTAYEMVLKAGYSNTMVYTGSFQDWVERGGPLEKL